MEISTGLMIVLIIVAMAAFYEIDSLRKILNKYHNNRILSLQLDITELQEQLRFLYETVLKDDQIAAVEQIGKDAKGDLIKELKDLYGDEYFEKYF